jgi:hypothetical protein
MDSFTTNTDKYTIVTGNSSNLYFPLTHLTIFQNGSQYFGVKVYNNLPDNIKQLSGNKNQFKNAVLQFFTYICFVVWENLLNIRIINLINEIQLDIDNYVNIIGKIVILPYNDIND